MRHIEQILPLWGLLVHFVPVKLGSQMFASSQQFCQDGELSGAPGPTQFHTVVGRNACTKADVLRAATGSGMHKAPGLIVTCPV